MSLASIISGSILLIFAVLIILIVLLQEGHQANLSGAIAGGADTFLGKHQARTVDNFLAKWTKIVVFAFFILTLVCDFFTILG